MLEDGQFTFVLSHSDVTGTVLDEIRTAKNNENGLVDLGNIKYTLADAGKTFYYAITEIDDDNSGYEYSDSVYIVKVAVTDNDNGTLSAQKTITKDGSTTPSALFTNLYETTDISVQFLAEKALSGRALADGQFTYILTSKADNSEIESVSNSADGSIVFSVITYTQADMGKTFVYELKEVNDKHSGYEYDNTVYTIIIDVVDNGDGTLCTNLAIEKLGTDGEAEEVGSIDFSNIYTAVGSIILEAEKTLDGRALAADEFSFVLTDTDGNILQTVKNDAEGKILFDEIFFSQDTLSTHEYQIYEIDGGAKGYSYDDTVYDLTLTVEDNGDGTLNIAYTVTKNSTLVEAILFANSYTADGSVKFSAEKILGGRALAADEFSFVLTDTDENILQTVKNNAEGKILFDEIFFTQDTLGEHLYKIYETLGNDDEITYDKSVFYLTVTVTDNGDGTLKTTLSIEKESGGAKTAAKSVTFTNLYEKFEMPPQTEDKVWNSAYILLIVSILCIAISFKRKKLRG